MIVPLKKPESDVFPWRSTMTAQMHEEIIYQGEEFGMADEPLLQYLYKIKNISFIYQSTACWRGYIGKWEIIDDKLYLVSLEGEAWVTDMVKYKEEKKILKQKLDQGLITSKENQKLLKELKDNLTTRMEVSIQTLFPGQDKVFASWFNGTIRIPHGKMLQYIHMGYESVFERDLFLEFKSGVLIKKWFVEN